MTWVELPLYVSEAKQRMVSIVAEKVSVIADYHGNPDACYLWTNDTGEHDGFTIALSRKETIRRINEALLSSSIDKELRDGIR